MDQRSVGRSDSSNPATLNSSSSASTNVKSGDNKGRTPFGFQALQQSYYAKHVSSYANEAAARTNDHHRPQASSSPSNSPIASASATTSSASRSNFKANQPGGRSGIRRPRGQPQKEEPKRHACPLCPRAFARPSALATHMCSHNGEKPHECPSCGRKFSVLSNMRRHLRIHGSEDMDGEENGGREWTGSFDVAMEEGEGEEEIEREVLESQSGVKVRGERDLERERERELAREKEREREWSYSQTHAPQPYASSVTPTTVRNDRYEGNQGYRHPQYGLDYDYTYTYPNHQQVHHPPYQQSTSEFHLPPPIPSSSTMRVYRTPNPNPNPYGPHSHPTFSHKEYDYMTETSSSSSASPTASTSFATQRAGSQWPYASPYSSYYADQPYDGNIIHGTDRRSYGVVPGNAVLPASMSSNEYRGNSSGRVLERNDGYTHAQRQWEREQKIS